MRKFPPIFFVLFSLVSVTAVQATVITVHDGDSFDFDASNQYVFADSITTADPQVTYGFELGLEDHSSLLVSAPAGINLVARITTGSDFGGVSIAEPGNFSRVLAGTSFEFPLWGDWTGIGAGSTWWLTVAVLDSPALLALENVYDGELPMGDVFAGTSYLAPPDTGDTGGDIGDVGDNGNGGNEGAGSVPEPATLALIGIGMIGMSYFSRSKRPIPLAV